MQNDPSDQQDSDERLRRDLGGLFQGAGPPSDLGIRLRAEAEARFGGQRGALPSLPAGRRRFALKTQVMAGAALAAAALLAVLVGGGRQTFAPHDLDRSGRVNVYDAYLVARAARSGDVSGIPDVNADGVITGADARALAQSVVTLGVVR